MYKMHELTDWSKALPGLPEEKQIEKCYTVHENISFRNKGLITWARVTGSARFTGIESARYHLNATSQEFENRT